MNVQAKTRIRIRPDAKVDSPTSGEVEALIERAKKQESGLDLLLNGPLDAVSATFGVHAFTVDEARAQLRPKK